MERKYSDIVMAEVAVKEAATKVKEAEKVYWARSRDYRNTLEEYIKEKVVQYVTKENSLEIIDDDGTKTGIYCYEMYGSTIYKWYMNYPNNQSANFSYSIFHDMQDLQRYQLEMIVEILKTKENGAQRNVNG